MADVAYVYALCDPRDGEVRYVGQAVDPKKRLRQHCNSLRERNHKANWIKKLKSLGLKPTLQILEECSIGDANWTEMWWIAYYKVLGYKLTNSTIGGDGTRGYMLSPEHRAKLSASRKGKQLSAEHKAKIGAANSNPSVSVRARMSAGKKGKQFSAEHRLKLSVANKGKHPSEEHKAKISVTMRGRPPNNAKLTPEQAKEIKVRTMSGEKQSNIARDFGISVSLVSMIKTGRTWKHLLNEDTNE